MVISSKNTVPPSPSSNRPFLSLIAPVNAPFLCPKSSDSNSVSGMVPQFIERNFLLLRRLLRCISRAIIPFPVPVSPRISTGELVSATLSISRYTSFITLDLPIKCPLPISFIILAFNRIFSSLIERKAIDFSMTEARILDMVIRNSLSWGPNIPLAIRESRYTAPMTLLETDKGIHSKERI